MLIETMSHWILSQFVPVNLDRHGIEIQWTEVLQITVPSALPRTQLFYPNPEPSRATNRREFELQPPSASMSVFELFQFSGQNLYFIMFKSLRTCMAHRFIVLAPFQLCQLCFSAIYLIEAFLIQNQFDQCLFELYFLIKSKF